MDGEKNDGKRRTHSRRIERRTVDCAERMTGMEAAIVRTVVALGVLGAPPTIAELWQHLDLPEDGESTKLNDLEMTLNQLVVRNVLSVSRGRYLPSEMKAELTPLLAGEEWMPRKLRKAKRIARWLAQLSGVRAVFLCNRTAFGLPRDEGDLDFFVIVRHGSIWQTRALGGLPFVLLGDRPKPGVDERDVVCLSFFLSDQALNLRACALQPDDMYLRHWFLGLLPLVDDGVGAELWAANTELIGRHPCALPWILSPDVRVMVPTVRIPVTRLGEKLWRALQWKYFPQTLRDKANMDTHVMISDERLKFHVGDGREAMQERYVQLCASYGILP